MNKLLKFYKNENLEVLKNLQNEFSEKINIIYIDPPYNTGKSFVYNDNFGNKNDRHSKWLFFMRERLEESRKLLKKDGCIFIAIGTEEVFRLKILCDEIFGEENFVNDFMWLHGKGKKDAWSRTMEEHTLCFAKDKRFLKPFRDFEITDWAKKNPDNDFRGNWFSGSISFSEKRSNKNHGNFYEISSPSGLKWKRQWFVSQEKMNELLSENKIYFGNPPEFKSVPRIKIFNGEKNEVIPKNILDNAESTRNAQKKLDSMLGGHFFENPKPVNLVKHLISIVDVPKNALILDFFAGSGTTFEAVCKMNFEDNGKRKCILIQKKEKTYKEIDGKIVALKNAENAFKNGFKTIAEITEERIKKVCQIYNISSEQIEIID